jgi:predicted peptidase
MRRSIALIVIFFCSFCSAQDLSLYEKHYFDAPELNLPYRLLRPAGADANLKYPLLVFLHGANEKGFDNQQQLAIGGKYFLRDSIRKNYPAYVLFPQCPEIDSWAYFESVPEKDAGGNRLAFPFKKNPTEVSRVLMRLIDSLVHADRIDSARIYIAGLSQGGMGVLDLVARYPSVFAAGLSICGAGNVSTCKYFAGKTALWLFHGDSDDILSVGFSRSYFKKLQKLGADVRYSEYPQVKHNSWVNAFQEPDLMAWLFSRKKK